MNTIENSIFMLALIIAISACSVDQEHQISGAYADINAMQILDPMAPENNNGIVNSLEGNVGQKAMKGYQASTFSPKEGRIAATIESVE